MENPPLQAFGNLFLECNELSHRLYMLPVVYAASVYAASRYCPPLPRRADFAALLNCVLREGCGQHT